MVTVRPTSSLPRTRLTWAGLLRVSWLAALLLGLLYTHGVSGESAAAHMSTGSTAASAHASSHAAEVHPAGGGTPAEHSDGHHEPAPADHDDEAGHAGPSCLSGKPQQGVDLPEPCTTPTDVVPLAAPTETRALEPAVVSGSAPSPPQRDPAILQV
ncbi:DUF6153 family protein [Streptomyces sp. 8N616]|uniref:DUF6153 family protein n=1 Tax=Streptomyces sp. 8N616 TaxID=3457414 RepID=UPI003FD25B16